MTEKKYCLRCGQPVPVNGEESRTWTVEDLNQLAHSLINLASLHTQHATDLEADLSPKGESRYQRAMGKSEAYLAAADLVRELMRRE